MPEPLPLMVGYVLWFVFVIAWLTPVLSANAPPDVHRIHRD